MCSCQCARFRGTSGRHDVYSGTGVLEGAAPLPLLVLPLLVLLARACSGAAKPPGGEKPVAVGSVKP